MGALTFHFPTKGELAKAVCAEGERATRNAVAHTAREAFSPLQGIVDVTHVLISLLTSEESVRATSRLAREAAAAPADWQAAWLPTVRELAERAHQEQALRRQTTPEVIVIIVTWLVAGAETAAAMPREAAVDLAPGGREQLTRLWCVLLPTLAAEGTRESLRAGPPEPTARQKP